MMGAISNKTLFRIQIMLNVTTVVFSFTSLIMVILVALFFFFQKTDMVGKPPTTGVYVGCFVVVFSMLVYDANPFRSGGVEIDKANHQSCHG